MRWTKIAGGAAAVVLGLSGCGWGGAGSGTGSPSAAQDTRSLGGGESDGPAPNQSSGDPAAEPPAAAMADTKAGAEAFAVWYLRQRGEAMRTADSAVLRDNSTDNCRACMTYAQGIDTNATKGLKANGNPYRVELKDSVMKSSGVRIVRTSVTMRSYTASDATGQYVFDNWGEEYEMAVTAVWRDGQWLADRLVGAR